MDATKTTGIGHKTYILEPAVCANNISHLLCSPSQWKIVSACFTSHKNSLFRCGPLIDLCRGPHVRHTGKIKAMQVTKVQYIQITFHITMAGCFCYYAIECFPSVLFLELCYILGRKL